MVSFSALSLQTVEIQCTVIFSAGITKSAGSNSADITVGVVSALAVSFATPTVLSTTVAVSSLTSAVPALSLISSTSAVAAVSWDFAVALAGWTFAVALLEFHNAHFSSCTSSTKQLLP